jgi:hypothetical protein
MKTKTRRKPRYEALLTLPPLSREEYEGLYQSIAVNGVLNAILVDCDGPRRRIIDGNHRKGIADELGYECPEAVHEGDEEELRTLARALNLARRHLSTEQKRQIVADQLRETPDRTNRVLAKMLGVSHPTVASVRAEMEAVGKLFQQGRRTGIDGKSYKPGKGITARAIVGDSDHRRQDDRYYTQMREIDALLGVERFPGETLDPCAGDGRIVRRLRRQGCRATGTDIRDGTDFFAWTKAVDNIVTNPPWRHKDDFILHAMQCANRKIALLLPLFALSGIRRLKEIYSNRSFPLKCVYVVAHRLQFDPSAQGGSTVVGGWFVWDRRHKGEPVIRWLP